MTPLPKKRPRSPAAAMHTLAGGRRTGLGQGRPGTQHGALPHPSPPPRKGWGSGPPQRGHAEWGGNSAHENWAEAPAPGLDTLSTPEAGVSPRTSSGGPLPAALPHLHTPAPSSGAPDAMGTQLREAAATTTRPRAPHARPAPAHVLPGPAPHACALPRPTPVCPPAKTLPESSARVGARGVPSPSRLRAPPGVSPQPGAVARSQDVRGGG